MRKRYCRGLYIQKAETRFADRDVVPIGAPTDTTHGHLAWRAPATAPGIVHPDSIIEHRSVNGLNVDRNPPEPLRVLDVVQTKPTGCARATGRREADPGGGQCGVLRLR